MTLPKFKDAFVDEMRERVAAGYRARMEAMNSTSIPHRHPGFMLTDMALMVDVIDRLARERDGIAESYERARGELDRAAKVVNAARAAVEDSTLYRHSDSDVPDAGHELVSAVLEYDRG